MLFSSTEFLLVFLPITLAIYFILAAFKGTKHLLVFVTLASLFFYGYWKIEYLAIIIISILGNFVVGRLITDFKTADREGSAKLTTTIGIVLNLVGLGYYKYAGFLAVNVSALIGADLPIMQILLPLGISFFTFQQIAYLADAYSGKVGRLDFFNYAAFVTFFPQLVAGPIVHHADMMPQFSKVVSYRQRLDDFALGAFVFSIGLAKKLVIADSVAPLAGKLFGNSEAGVMTFAQAWTGALAYTVQLYFDFSGYSDMAVGIGLMFSIKLMWNFNSPYKSVSIVEFWRRWHISLSNWLRDYLYIALGGNRKGETRRYANLFITMLLGGLWHGASWNFVIWGALHGTYLLFVHANRKLRTVLGLKARSENLIVTALAWLVTFFCVVVAWVYFRAIDVNSAHNMLNAMLFSGSIDFNYWKESLSLELVLIPIGLMIAFFAPNTPQMYDYVVARRTYAWAAGFYVGVLLVLSIIFAMRVEESPFLYFNF
jgi:D-alanyl-lipoteichoic acid acyltransferase DltB (MBOAT superfamily)